MQISHGHLYHTTIVSVYQKWRSVKCYVIGISDHSKHMYMLAGWHMTTDSFITCLLVGIVNGDREEFCEYLLLQITPDLYPKFISNFWETDTLNGQRAKGPNFMAETRS